MIHHRQFDSDQSSDVCHIDMLLAIGCCWVEWPRFGSDDVEIRDFCDFCLAGFASQIVNPEHDNQRLGSSTSHGGWAGPEIHAVGCCNVYDPINLDTWELTVECLLH